MSERPVFLSDVLPEHVRFVRSIARSLVLDENEAEDAVQETLLRALEQPPEPRNIRGWLRVVVRNCALRRRREERRRKRRELENAPRGHISSPHEIASRIEGQRRVLDAVRDLPEPYRSTIVHHYLDELTREQIAERLGIPLETVRTRLKRALRLLRERLDRDDHASSPWIAAVLPALWTRPPRGTPVATALVTKVAAVAAILGASALLLVSREPSHAPGRAAAEGVSALPASPAVAAPSDEATSGEPALRLFASGIVVDARGRAVPGAAVLAPDGSGSATAGDGRFRVPVAAADGRANVAVRKEGFLPWRGVLDALDPSGRTIRLERGAPISVVVLGPDRTPVAGARVEVLGLRERGVAGMWWSRRLLPLGEAVTDARGRAEPGAAPEGTVEVRVDDPRFAGWRREVGVSGTDPVVVESVLSGGGDVAGRVTDHAGQPVPGARVYARAAPDRVAVTRADGSYELRVVAEGECRILAEAEGFGVAFFGAGLGWGKPVPVRVRAGRTVRGVDLALVPAIEVLGRVVDADGRPLEGVSVGGLAGPCAGRSVGATTDDRGRFSIGPFAATDGRALRLTFEAPGHVIDPFSREMPGEPGTLDIGDIRAQRLGGIRGTVVDVDGNPLRGGRVELLAVGHATLVGEDGAFALAGVPPGPARIRASAFGPLRRSEEERVEVEAGAVADVVLRLRPTLPIRGRVVSPAGRPRAGVVVAALADADRPAARATTGPDGTFELPDLPQRTYLVGILREPLAEETATPDSLLDFTDDGLHVSLVVPGLVVPGLVKREQEGVLLPDPRPEPARAGSEGLEFVLPARGTVVDARVVSAETGLPVPAFEVSFIEYWHGLIPRGSDTIEVRDAGGRFAQELAEGDWAVEIAAPGYARQRTPLFPSGSRATWSLGTIRLGPGGGVRGAVRDASGQAVSYTRLYLLGPQLQTHRRPIFTDETGSYAADGITPGTYTVFVLSPRHPFAVVRNVAIGEEERSLLDVNLDRPSPVTVIVTDAAGRPVQGADVSYTCEALLPLTSRLLRSHEPPGWGGHRTDGEGRLRKVFLPAGRVSFRVSAEGFLRATRDAELRQDCETVVEVRLERER